LKTGTGTVDEQWLLQNPPGDSVLDKLGGAVRVEFAHKSVAVIFDGSLATGKHPGDLLVRLAGDDRLEDLHLARGQMLAGHTFTNKNSLYQPIGL